MTPLSDLQLVLLSTAAQRRDGSLLPPPDSLRDRTARLGRSFTALLAKALIVEVDVTAPDQTWWRDGERRIGVVITAAGRAAIGVSEDADEVVALRDAEVPLQAVASESAGEAAGAAGTKVMRVLALLRRPEGATLDELIAVTGWLPHTTRAALTRLRQKGHVLDRGKRGDRTRYAIVEAA